MPHLLKENLLRKTALLLLLMITFNCWALPTLNPTDSDFGCSADTENVISFREIGLTVDISGMGCLLYNGPVEDIDREERSIVRRMGIEAEKVIYNNGAENGRQVAFRLQSGKKLSCIMVKSCSDLRVEKALEAHEKFHALYHIHPEAVKILESRLNRIGYDLELSALDEETAATVIEIVSLHRMGIPFDAMRGNAEFVTTLKIVKRSFSNPIRS